MEEFVGQKKVNLLPVYGNNAENKEWSTYTPSGQIWMVITNPGAYDQFVIGKDYLVTFNEA